MELQSDYDNICEQYLLGELSESECQQLEEAYFADDSLFERFLAVKDDLLDAYARGDLTDNKLKSFEQHYLASEARRQKAGEARELIQATSNLATLETESTHLPRSRSLSGWQWFSNYLSLHPIAKRAGLVAAIVLILAGGWILVRQIQDRNARRAAEDQARKIAEPQETTADNGNRQAVPAPTSSGEQAASSPSPSTGPKPEIAVKPPSPVSAQIASLTILPISSRDSSSSEPLILSPEARVVHLNLIFSDGSYDSFDASVRTVDGQQVIRRTGLIARPNEKGKLVTVIFDSSLLQRQDHIATLRGRVKNGRLETIAEYYFRVQRDAHESNPTPPKE